jgi:predicted kinase
MRQFDRREQLSSLLARGDVDRTEISALAELLADFHAASVPVGLPADFAGPADVRAMIQRNLDELAAVCPASAAARIARQREWLEERLAVLGPLIASRRAHGRVREGHGDLHARNIVRWQGRLVPFDCLEFDAALRRGDVALDLAFPYMDLESKRRADLAAVLLDSYCARSGDYEALTVLDLYAVHRALVRAKIDALELAGAVRPHLQSKARMGLDERLDVIDRLIARRDPALVLMHGPSGSGKSWVSEAAVPVLPAVRIRSDVERRRILGVAPGRRTGSPLHGGAYAADVSDRTYQRLHDCARAALLGGRHVIVDATFLEPRRRAPFIALAGSLGCRLLIASCHAEADELRRRVAARSAQGNDPSEATVDVLEDQLRCDDRLMPDEQPYRFPIDTGQIRSAETVARALAAALDSAPRPASVG